MLRSVRNNYADFNEKTNFINYGWNYWKQNYNDKKNQVLYNALIPKKN